MNYVSPSITGFEASGVMGNKEVKSLLDSLPRKHVSNPPLRSIVYKDIVISEMPAHRKYPAMNVLGSCVINENDSVANITLYRQQENGNLDEYDFRVSIVHEIGHVVFEYFLNKQKQQEWYSYCVDAGMYWNPAGRDPLEHFCDTYAQFYFNNLMVKKIFPNEYGFLTEHVF